LEIYAEFNRKLAAITARMERVFELEGILDGLERQRIRLAGRVIKANRKLIREKKDVRRLERRGIFGLLRSLIGGGDRGAGR